MKNNKVRIEYTQSVKTCLEDITFHLSKMDIDSKTIIANTLEQFEGKVSQFPYGCPVCPELVKLGVAKYRECNTAGGYRVLYSVDGSTVTAHAILSHRQDIKLLLFKRLIQA